MIKNRKISSNINMWNIEYDQSGFTLNTDWLIQAKKTEDNIKSAKTTFTYFFIALALILLSTPFDKLF